MRAGYVMSKCEKKKKKIVGFSGHVPGWVDLIFYPWPDLSVRRRIYNGLKMLLSTLKRVSFDKNNENAS